MSRSPASGRLEKPPFVNWRGPTRQRHIKVYVGWPSGKGLEYDGRRSPANEPFSGWFAFLPTELRDHIVIRVTWHIAIRGNW